MLRSSQPLWKQVSIASLASPSGALEHKDIYRFCEFKDLRWTNAEMTKHTRAFAAGLLDARVRPGDTVLSMFNSDSETPMSFIAATLAGVKTCFVGSACDVETLDRALIATNARAAVFRGIDEDGTDGVSVWYDLLPKLQEWPNGRALRFSRYPTLKGLFYATRQPLCGMLQMSTMFIGNPMPDPLRKTIPAINEDDVVASSFEGTTLRSFTHRQLLDGAKHFADGVALGSTDRVLYDASVNSPTGQAISTLACMSNAAMQIAASGDFDAKASLQAIGDEFVTTVVGTPATLDALIENKSEDTDASTLKKVVVVADIDDPSVKQVDTARITQAFPQVKSVHFALTHPDVVGAAYISADGKPEAVLASDVASRVNVLATADQKKKLSSLGSTKKLQ